MNTVATQRADIPTRPAVVHIGIQIDAAGATIVVRAITLAGAVHTARGARASHPTEPTVFSVGVQIGANPSATVGVIAAAAAAPIDAKLVGSTVHVAGPTVRGILLSVHAGLTTLHQRSSALAFAVGADAPRRADGSAPTTMVRICCGIDALTVAHYRP